MLAGHKTTANATTWTLHELAKHPEIQSQLREEIMQARSRAGASDFTAADYNNMPFTIAVMKVAYWHTISRASLAHLVTGKSVFSPNRLSTW